MQTGLKHLHSYWAYVTIALLLFVTAYFIYKMAAGKSIATIDKKYSLFAMIALHLQFVFGLILYFVTPLVNVAFQDFGGAIKTENLRFTALEHPIAMLLAVILATLAHIKVKKGIVAGTKATVPAILFLIGLLLVLSRIPWDAWPSN